MISHCGFIPQTLYWSLWLSVRRSSISFPAPFAPCGDESAEQEESERAPRICLFTSRLVFRRHFALVPQNFSTFTIMLAYTSLSLCILFLLPFYRITIYTLLASESNPPWLGCKLCLHFFLVPVCTRACRGRERGEKCVQKRRVAKTGKFIWICGCWM